jgi:hypothetical protein
MKVLGMCFIVLLLISCAPAVTVQYYRPITTEGAVVNAHCPPVDSFVLFEEHNIIVGAQVVFSDKGKLSSTITFEVPKDKTVQLLDQNVLINTPSQGLSKIRLSGYTWVGPGRTSEFFPENPLVGKTKKKLLLKQVTLYGTTNHAYYVFYASVDVLKPEQVSIKIPKFSVNDFEVELPEIKFDWSSKYFPVYPANC